MKSNQAVKNTMDHAKAFSLIDQAEGKEHGPATNRPGECCLHGNGGQRDVQEAFYRFSKAAWQNGNGRALYNIGLCYEQGLGVDQNSENAVFWFRKAAELGNARGQNSLGFCCLVGNGVIADFSKAFSWFRKAAEKQHLQAYCNIGLCFEHGLGVDKNPEKAVSWYTKAAEKNLATGQLYLGICCCNGIGTDRDMVKGFAWIYLAAMQGNRAAEKRFEALSRNMLEKNIEKGIQLADLYQEMIFCINNDTPVLPGADKKVTKTVLEVLL